MPYCYNCGVKLDDDASYCPLCGAKTPVNKKQDDQSIKSNDIENKINIKNKIDIENNTEIDKNNSIYPSYEKSSEKQKLTSILEIISVSFIISIISIVLINLILDSKISWSKIPSVTIFFAWLIIVSILIFYKKIIYSFLFIFLSIFGYLISLDSLDKKIGWSFTYALPILISCLIIFLLLFLLTTKTKQKGLNLIAYYLIGGCLICFAIDLIINFNISSFFLITWSKYVSFAVIPMSLFLLYIHHRFVKKLPGKRIFRI